MARTPSITPEQALEAIGVKRGNMRFVASSIISPLRKYLNAMGIPGAYVANMTRAEWIACYNDVTNVAIATHKAKAIESNNTGDANDDIDSNDTVAPSSNEANPKIDSVLKDLGNIIAQGGCNRSQVESIVDDKLSDLPNLVAQYANHIVLTIKQPDMADVTIEGHVHPMFPRLVQMATARQSNGMVPNIMLKGPTGSGKTHACAQLAKALGKEFYTNGAISMDHQLIGFRDAAGTYHETPLRQAFGKPSVYLFDEIDSSDNMPLLCLAGLLANGGFSFPDVYVDRHPDSVIIAAGNTWGLGANAEFVGRNRLDGAIRSRFPGRIDWGYDEKLERAISGNVDWACHVQKARANANRAGLKVTIDPRMTQAGAAYIANGMSFDEAAEFTFLADLTNEQREIVMAD